MSGEKTTPEDECPRPRLGDDHGPHPAAWRPLPARSSTTRRSPWGWLALASKTPASRRRRASGAAPSRRTDLFSARPVQRRAPSRLALTDGLPHLLHMHFRYDTRWRAGDLPNGRGAVGLGVGDRPPGHGNADGQGAVERIAAPRRATSTVWGPRLCPRDRPAVHLCHHLCQPLAHEKPWRRPRWPLRLPRRR